jgi:hypothetical protein
MFYSKNTGGFYSVEIHGDGIPEDAVEIGAELYEVLFAGQAAGKKIVLNQDGLPTLENPPPPSAEQIQASFVAAIQQRMDEFARTRGYDGILSACTYAASSIPKFRVEGQYCVDARDATWSAAYAILAEVMSGDRQIPSSIESIENDLPPLAWPQS